VVRVLLLASEDHVLVSELISEARSGVLLQTVVSLPNLLLVKSLSSLAGVYGLKPTTRRLPNSGLIAASGPQENIVPTIGPLSTSLEGVKIFTKTLIDAKPWLHDPALLPFPWKEEDFFQGRKIKVAVIWDDGVVKPHPPVTRALKQVVDKLAANDKFEVVEWKPYEHYRAWEIIVSDK
jgi:amidase